MNKALFALIFTLYTEYNNVLFSQNTFDSVSIDNHLTSIYKKFSDNKHDYAGKYGEARDSILIRFQNTLAITLGKESFLMLNTIRYLNT
ncbi:hypothetical protein [Maribacter sp.]|uniref:hypothetical protein n=1 Tax=Maribacter sp. TaxID=1897614 RepID=UPI003298D914